MQMVKRWTRRLVLTVLLLAAFSAVVFADESDIWYDETQEETLWEQQETVFPDVTGEKWFYDDVMYLYRSGIIGGFPDGTFRPEDKVTTGQALKMIILAAGYPEPEAAASHWARGYLNFALEQGILERGEITDLDVSMSRLLTAKAAARASASRGRIPRRNFPTRTRTRCTRFRRSAFSAAIPTARSGPMGH